MGKTHLAATTVLISLTMIGCSGSGGGSSTPPTIITQILSDHTIEGDIEVPVSGPIIVTDGTSFPNIQSVFAGIDPASSDEFRAFLDFPLSGPDGVPPNAVIVSATLDIFIDNVILQVPGDTVPIRIDLVSFTPPLFAGAFDRTSLTPIDTIFIGSITSTDIGTHVFVDVTSFMTEVQNMGVANFQIRILVELGPVTPGVIEIDYTTGAKRVALAPLVQVEYF